MTLRECKEEIAKQLISERTDRPNFKAGYLWWSWKQYCYPSTKELEEALDRVCELYAKQKPQEEQKPDFQVKTDLEKHLAVTLRLVQKERDALQFRVEKIQQQITTEITVRDGVLAMYDFLLEENCELRKRIKHLEEKIEE